MRFLLSILVVLIFVVDLQAGPIMRGIRARRDAASCGASSVANSCGAASTSASCGSVSAMSACGNVTTFDPTQTVMIQGKLYKFVPVDLPKK